MSWFARFGDDDDGFTLIEVVVSLMVFALLLAGTASLTISGLRGLLVSRMDTTAKNLTQQRVEAIRNLPFFVSATITGGSPDLFDGYYVNTTSMASTTASSGFVPAGGARDTSLGDPATGAFYRTMVAPSSDPHFAPFSQRVTVQLLNADGSVVANPNFDSASTGVNGMEPATLVGLTVTTTWRAANVAKKFSMFTEVADADSKADVVTLQARMSALRISGELPNLRELLLEAGVVNLDGSLSSSTAASAVGRATFGSIDNGVTGVGASDYVSAPPTTSHPSSTGSAFSLTDSLTNNIVGQVGGSRLDNIGASTTGGLPSAGSSSAPITSTMFGGGYGNNALTADIEPSSSRLRLESPLVQLYASGCGGSCAAAQGRGYITSTGGPTHSATASTGASMAGTLILFPTEFAPGGLIRINLTSASLTCTATATASPRASASASYSATLQFFYGNGTSGGYSSPLNLNANNSSDPLATVPLTTTQVWTDSTGAPLYLKDYITTWSSLTAPVLSQSTKLSQNNSQVSVSFPGFITIQSVPFRSEAESTMGIQLGATSCTAGDLR